MNIIDILVLLILGYSLFAGMHKGFLASLLSLGGLVGSWFGAQKLFLPVAEKILSNSGLIGTLSQYLEPASFFEGITVSGVTASTTVADLVSRGQDAVQQVADFIGTKIPFVRDAFASNISSEAFTKLNLTTLSEYLDQTVWQSAFYVISFIACFFVLYFVANLVVNLLNHVIRFPVLRKVDWLMGGIFGLCRGLIVAALVLAVLPSVVSLISPEFLQTMQSGSAIWSFFEGSSALGFVKDWVNQLIMGVF